MKKNGLVLISTVILIITIGLIYLLYGVFNYSFMRIFEEITLVFISMFIQTLLISFLLSYFLEEIAKKKEKKKALILYAEEINSLIDGLKVNIVGISNKGSIFYDNQLVNDKYEKIINDKEKYINTDLASNRFKVPKLNPNNFRNSEEITLCFSGFISHIFSSNYKNLNKFIERNHALIPLELLEMMTELRKTIETYCKTDIMEDFNNYFFEIGKGNEGDPKGASSNFIDFIEKNDYIINKIYSYLER